MDFRKTVIVLGLITVGCNPINEINRIPERGVTIDPDIGILGVVQYGQTKQSLDTLFDKDGEAEKVYNSGLGSGGKEYSKINCTVNFVGDNPPKAYSVSQHMSWNKYVVIRHKRKEFKVYQHTKMDEFKQFFKNSKVVDATSGFEVPSVGIYVSYENDSVNEIYVSDMKW